MCDDDLDYLRRRIAEETHRAKNAASSPIAAIHRQMASAYADRIEALTQSPPDPKASKTLSLRLAAE